MATIGMDFYQSKQERKSKLKEILEDQKSVSNIKVTECNYVIGGLILTINEDNSGNVIYYL